MTPMLRRALSLLRANALYLALLAASALACALLATRILRAHSLTYVFLPWNLALAWIPLVLAVAVRSLGARRSLLTLPTAAAWWIFFPNAFYLVTDLVHYRAHPHVPPWFDVALLVTFAWSGTALALSSLALVHAYVRERHGALGGWSFALLACLSTGFGIWLGRVRRFNSWDAALHPLAVLRSSVEALLVGPGAYSAWGVTLAFGGLLMILHVTVTSLAPAAATPARSARNLPSC